MSELVVYYNSACPVCDAGIALQRRRMREAGYPVAWRDVHEEPGIVGEIGADLDAVRRKLHVRDQAGRLQIGIDAFAALWAATPAERWKAQLVRAPLLHFLSARAYDGFAALLFWWNRRQRRW